MRARYWRLYLFLCFFFNDTATTEIYTLSLHDALPISDDNVGATFGQIGFHRIELRIRSEEHTSELQSLRHLVCRLLLEKKKKHTNKTSNAGRHLQSLSRLTRYHGD